MNQEEIYNKLSKEYTIEEIQKYIKEMVFLRKFKYQDPEHLMLLLVEETGELAKAIRKSNTNMEIDKNKLENYDTVESEVADVFFVLTSLCNSLNIDLFECLKNKEGINIKRNWGK